MPILYLMCIVFGAFVVLGLITSYAAGSISELFVCTRAGAIMALGFGLVGWILT